ncbi:MAG: agmatinase family protein [Bacteroidota bacterium]
MPCSPSEASIIIIPAPWEVTVSSRSGTALGPESVLKASYQLDSSAREYTAVRKMGIAMLPIPHEWKMRSDMLRHDTAGHIHALELGMHRSTLGGSVLKKINWYTRQFKEEIRAKALTYLNKGKLVALLGGDHSTALGLIEALAEKHKELGILHVDAHATLRGAYQGFTYSHASIMHHALKLPQIKKLVQVGLRDYAGEEVEIIAASKGRIVAFLNEELKQRRFQGVAWDASCREIVDALPDEVYVSFDIDGLDPKLCPSTGTPVPGGLDFDEVSYLLERVVEAGKKIVGFDLCEVAPGENIDWDARVGSRLLYRLALNMGASQGKLPIK